MTDKQQKPHYPNAFLFGCVAGATLQKTTRRLMWEPLAYRPFSYIRVGLFFGCALSLWDYQRRRILEQVLEAEEKVRYFQTVKAIN